MKPCTISQLMSCAINIKWLELVWATTTIGGRVNRRDKKVTAQINAKSITDSHLDGAHGGSFSPVSVLCGPPSCVRFMR